MRKMLIGSFVIAAVAGWTTFSAFAQHEHEKGDKKDAGKKEEVETKTIKGEVVDLACYLDHGARGEKHKECAVKCITGGLPVGILTSEGPVLVIGDHKPINDKLAPFAAQRVEVTGKLVRKGGMHMIEVANPDKDIVKEPVKEKAPAKEKEAAK